MDTCIIFGAAEFDGLLQPPASGDFLLAADGGLSHLQRLGLKPQGILGDFDSLGYVPEGAQVYPVEKDDTDVLLAVRKGLALGYRRFVLYGALDGPRLDHTIANLQTLVFLAEHGARGYLIGKRYLVTTVCRETLRLPARARGILSVFCLGAPARGVTLEGLQYPLREGTLESGFPLGVSNHFTGSPASVTVREGCLILLYDAANGFPEEPPAHAL